MSDKWVLVRHSSERHPEEMIINGRQTVDLIDTLRRAVEIAKLYSLSSLNHTERCLPSRFYPGLGKMDDRCNACKRMDELMNDLAWEKVQESEHAI